MNRQTRRLAHSVPLRGGESGQLALLVAITMVAMVGFVALAVDLGFMTHSRRGVQNDADFMALAGVRELTRDGSTQTEREAAAEVIAREWAALNDVDNAEIVDIFFNTTCSGDSVPDTISVQLRRNQQTFFASIFGISSGNLNVCATARTGMAKGGPGLLPVGLLYDDPAIASDPPLCFFNDPDNDGEPHPNFWDEECTIKIPKPNDTWTPGNSGPLRLDDNSGVDPDNEWPSCDPPGNNSGSDEYTENLDEGSECGYAPGDEVQTKTGSMNSISCDAIDDRLDGNTDDLDDVFTDADSDGIYDIVDESHPRYGLIPVVIVAPGSSGSSTPVTIYTFVTVYIVGCVESGSGANTEARMTVIPVQSDIYVEGIDFVEPSDPGYDETSWPLFTIKLVE